MIGKIWIFKYPEVDLKYFWISDSHTVWDKLCFVFDTVVLNTTNQLTTLKKYFTMELSGYSWIYMDTK